MPVSFTSRLISFISAIFLILITPAAADEMLSSQWVFEPDIGFEGRASVQNKQSYRLEIEYGNSGYLNIAMLSQNGSMNALIETTEVIPLQIEIDENIFDQKFTCHSRCDSYGIPSNDLISAIRRGKHLTIRRKGSLLAEFTLAGSNAAISQVSK